MRMLVGLFVGCVALVLAPVWIPMLSIMLTLIIMGIFGILVEILKWVGPGWVIVITVASLVGFIVKTVRS